MRICGAVVLFGIGAGLALGAEAATPASRMGDCDARKAGVSATPGFRVVRMLEDPGSHQFWLIERNAARPGWPARAIRVEQNLSCFNRGKFEMSQANKEGGLQGEDAVIHAGEGLLIVDETPASRAELEAVALSNGRRGETIAARLRIGGRVVSTLVVARGRAVLNVLQTEGQR